MPRALWVLTGGQFINRFGAFVYPFLALYLVQQGYSGGQVAMVLGAMALGNLMAPFVSGYLADAIGRRNTIVIALVGGATAIILLYYCRTLGQLVVVGAAQGFLAQLFGPAANALMSDVVPEDKRVTAYAVFRLALNAGFAAGPAVAGLLYTRSPALIFWGDAATTLIFAALALGFLPHGLRTIKGRVTSLRVAWQSWVEAAVDARCNYAFLQLLAGKLLMSIAFVQVFNVLALDTAAHGLSTVDYGLVMGLNGAIIMLVELPLVQWIKRYPARPVLTVGFLTVGLGCASFGWAKSMFDYALAMAFFTIGEMISLPVSAAHGARLAPTEYRGRYFGFFGMVWGVAGLTGSSGIWIFERVGGIWWIWTGAFGVAAALCMAIRVPQPGRSARAA